MAADVRGRSWRFGLRRLVVALGVVALVGSTASLGRAALAGWWGAPTTSYAALLRFVDAEAAEGSSRVLWAGDPALVPGGEGWDLGDGLSYATSVGAVPTVADRWPATGDERAAGLREALDAALAGRTTRLGERLAPFGVAYVAVPATLAPGDDTPPAPATATLTGALATQLDLERVRVDPDLVLYLARPSTPAAPGRPGARRRGPARGRRPGGAVAGRGGGGPAAPLRAVGAAPQRPGAPGRPAARRHPATPRPTRPGATGRGCGPVTAGIGNGNGHAGAPVGTPATGPPITAAPGPGRWSSPGTGARWWSGPWPSPRWRRRWRARSCWARPTASRLPDPRPWPRPTPALMPAVPPAASGSSTWYCAAGPRSPTAPPTTPWSWPTAATPRSRRPWGGPRRRAPPPARPPPPSPVPSAGWSSCRPRSRVEVRLGDVVAAPLAAAVVEAAGPGVAVEHRVSGPYGSDVAPCASFAAPTWHFAWGSTTRDARELVVLFNPFPSPATVDAIFTTEDGPGGRCGCRASRSRPAAWWASISATT